MPIDSNPPRLKLLWDSPRAGVAFDFSKFCPAVVADGRLLVPTYDGRVDVCALNLEGASINSTETTDRHAWGLEHRSCNEQSQR